MNELRTTRIDLLSKKTDKGVERIVRRFTGKAPNRLQQDLAMNDLTNSAHERCKKFELGGCQVYACGPAVDFLRCWVKG